jgi:hypothetical protein
MLAALGSKGFPPRLGSQALFYRGSSPQSLQSLKWCLTISGLRCISGDRAAFKGAHRLKPITPTAARCSPYLTSTAHTYRRKDKSVPSEARRNEIVRTFKADARLDALLTDQEAQKALTPAQKLELGFYIEQKRVVEEASRPSTSQPQ